MMISKRKHRLCPQCKISGFYIKNDSGDRRLIKVTADYEIVPAKEGETLEGFDTETIYCLGCSWSGSVKRTV